MVIADDLTTSDWSDNFAPLRRQLDASEYQRFRKGLVPRYGIVWRDVLLAYAAAIIVMAGVVLAEHELAGMWGWLVVPVAAVVLGFVVHYISCFIHEAAHGGLAPTRRMNDVLYSVVIGPLLGNDVRSYRNVHGGHHRYLGTARDTERSYFNDLSARFVIESLTGIRVLRAALVYRGVQKTMPRAPRHPWMTVVAIMFHLLVVAGCVVFGAPWAALVWVLGVAVFYPFFASLRQLLEHRADDAEASLDYALHDHGAFTRMFAPGLGRLFGSAGFDRHLLHHWEPQLSYTRLRDLERYLIESPISEVLEGRRSTYIRTARKLASRSR